MGEKVVSPALKTAEIVIARVCRLASLDVPPTVILPVPMTVDLSFQDLFLAAPLPVKSVVPMHVEIPFVVVHVRANEDGGVNGKKEQRKKTKKTCQALWEGMF